MQYQLLKVIYTKSNSKIHLNFFSESDLIYTEQQTSRKSMVQQLTCACRRQQCNWSRPGNTAVKKIFCAQPFECTNPTDFFPNDYNGKYPVNTLLILKLQN